MTIWSEGRCCEEFCMRSQYLLLSWTFSWGAGENHVVPSTKAVPITGCQANGLAFPIHDVPLLPDGVMEEVKVKSVRNSSVY